MLGRQAKGFAEMCEQCDAHGGLHAAITGQPYIYRCHADLVDFAVPLIVNGSYMGAVLGGQVRLQEESERELEHILPQRPNWKRDKEWEEACLLYTSNRLVDPDIFISRQNELAEQLRAAKLEKERFLKAEEDQTIQQTQELIETLEAGPDFLDAFDGELFRELVDKIIVESNDRLRFRLVNGLELTEPIERTVR